MEIQKHPELLDRLSSAYALGTLRGAARRRFETLARERPAVRASALLWQSRFQSFNEIQPAEDPPPAVWKRIDNLVQAEKSPRQVSEAADATPHKAIGWFESVGLWRRAALTGFAGTGLAAFLGLLTYHDLNQEVTQLQQALDRTAVVEYVAVLNDAQANAALLVTFDPQKQTLTLQRVGTFEEAADRSLQLWAIAPEQQPRSLGVMSKDKVLQLESEPQAIRNTPVLAVSLEPFGGVPEETGPTGPVLFQGPLIQKML